MKNLLTPIALALPLATGACLMPMTASAELTGNIGIHSKYLLRGTFEENDGAAVQGGLDYGHESGFYAGWWFSSLGYNYESDAVDDDATGTGVENDFYAGFAGEMGSVGYDVGQIQYV